MSFEHALFVTFSHPHTPQALRQVVELIRRHDGRTTAMAVIAPAPALQRLLTPHGTTEQVETMLREELLSDLHDWTKRATKESEPADVEILVETGHVVATVLDRVVDEDHDLLAVTSHPEDPAARAIIKRLQRKSPCPVWAIRPDRARNRRILAALDTDDEHHGLDHRILSASSWLARPEDELHIVTAWELMGEATLRSSPFIGANQHSVDELHERCEAEHRQVLENLVAEHSMPTDDIELHVRNSSAPEAIVDLVERHKINQLVIGTIGRSGLPGLLIGNTAEELLTEVTCSILVVKPPGFVTPYGR
ncbi:MAG: universal stress protein [Ilumatobacter sp.]|uniref:universal stress protein n=1 Tax=Ilumatobacter sp. TaxID=1967498 RepID=UPI0026111A0A|nr:universal stress protein [Ilumatobacter sp.]MDJ0771468.1 universal stress protein [Ilumatobacter sp.]